METILVNKKDAIKLHTESNKKGKKILEKIIPKNVFITNICDRIKTIEDVFELNNTTEKDFNEKWKNFPDRYAARDFEELIVAAYNNNNGELPDFNDGTLKCSPIFKHSSSGVGFACSDCDDWHSVSSVGSRLCFYGPDCVVNMKDAVKKFLPQFEKSRTL